MPVEIRELIIKTEVVSNSHNRQSEPGSMELARFKKQVLAECQRMVLAKLKREAFNR